jgi:hypothetical protein
LFSVRAPTSLLSLLAGPTVTRGAWFPAVKRTYDEYVYQENIEFYKGIDNSTKQWKQTYFYGEKLLYEYAAKFSPSTEFVFITEDRAR